MLSAFTVISGNDIRRQNNNDNKTSEKLGQVDKKGKSRVVIFHRGLKWVCAKVFLISASRSGSVGWVTCTHLSCL